jgi:hypothetical protein
VLRNFSVFSHHPLLSPELEPTSRECRDDQG